MSKVRRRKAPVVAAPDETGGLPPEEETVADDRSSPMGLFGALKLVSGLAIILGTSGAVAWGSYRFACTTSRFAIHKVEVEGIRRHTESSIARIAGVQIGDNIFGVEIDKAEQTLLADPWIYEVKITRRLPNTLHVQLTEHVALAVAALGQALYLINRDGVPFREIAEGDPYDLPVLTGIRPERLADEGQPEIARVQLALEALRQYERLPLSGQYPPEEVHLEKEGGIVMTIGKQPITLQLGRAPWRKKLLKAARVLGKVRAQGQVPGILFLDNEAHPERVVVRMR